MSSKQDILLIESTVQASDDGRWKAMAEKFNLNLIRYECGSIVQFKERLKPGGAYDNIVAIVRNAWLKAGLLDSLRPFATDVVPCYPDTPKLICCSGHGYDAADTDAITARGIWYCNTPDACTEAVANTALSLVLDSFRYLTYAQWCARYDWYKSRNLGLKAVDPTRKSLGIVGLGDIGLAVARKCEAAFDMRTHYQGPRRKVEAEKRFKQPATYYSTVDEMIPHVDCILIAAPYTPSTRHLLSSRHSH